MTFALFLAAAVSALPTVPGAANPAVTQDNLKTTVCVHGWAANERKSLGSRAETMKLADLKAAGLPPSAAKLYELDHVRSIVDGGSPTDPNNLDLEPWHIMLRYPDPVNSPLRDWGARTKDRVEVYVHKQMCAGKITLDQGGHMLTDNWMATYYAAFGEPPDKSAAPHGNRDGAGAP
jgi:hypothetical protein